MTTAGGRTGSARAAGLTLVEVLVALSIAMLLTAALANLLAGTRASERALEGTLNPRRTLDLGAELLAEEVSLAGHLPWPPPTLIDGLEPGNDVVEFLTPGVSVEAVSGGHRVTVRYVDDRLEAGPRARIVTFEAGLDGRAEPQLYRRPGAAVRQPLVAGVDALLVLGVVQGGVVVEPDFAVDGEPAWALVVRLAAGSVTRDVVIALPSRPHLAVNP